METLSKSYAFNLALLFVALLSLWSQAHAQDNPYTRQIRQTGRQIRDTYRRSQQDSGRQLEARRQRTQNYVNARRSTRVPVRYRDLPPLFNMLGTAITGGELGAVEVMVPVVIDAYQRRRRKQ